MKHLVVSLSLPMILFSAAGCGGGGDGDGSSGGSTSTGGMTTSGGMTSGGMTGSGGTTGNACPMRGMDATTGNMSLVAAPANNYSFSSTLSFPPVAVAADSELTFSWGGVTTDFLEHTLDPMADIDTVNLMLWTLTEQDLQTKLNNDELAQRDLAVIATLYTQKMRTSGTLFEFTSVGMELPACDILNFMQLPNPDPGSHPECDWQADDPDCTCSGDACPPCKEVPDGYDPALNTYTVMIATGEELGQGTRMIQSFKLDPTSTNTTVEVTDTSTHLEYTVDLHSHQKTPLPAGQNAITVDWDAMTVNALGLEFIPTYIDDVLVASFSKTPAEMEAEFLDLEEPGYADALYRGEVTTGTSFSLADLATEAGQPFTGIDDSHTWILALFCGRCANPAPWYLSILTTCAP